MILSDLLAALASNAAVNITLLDENNEPLITFGASGYASIENDIAARTVRKIQITSGKEMTISLEPASP